MMDAVIIGSLCSQPVHFIIRSDMFKNSLFRFLLRFLNGIPVYRISEEKNRLKDNFTTFDACRKILQKKGIILIFSEGVTMHDWKLKPLKSGTVRIVSHALENNELRKSLQVAAVGLTYSSYTQLSKTVIVHAAKPFYPGELQQEDETWHFRQAFNESLFSQLTPLVPCMTSENLPNILLWQATISNLTITDTCKSAIERLHQQASHLSQVTIAPHNSIPSEPFYVSKTKRNFFSHVLLLLLLALPAMAGILLNGVYYLSIVRWCRKKTMETIFFDSLLFGATAATYHLYILLLSILLHHITPVAWWIWLALVPITGWCSLQANVKLQSIAHYLKRKTYLLNMQESKKEINNNQRRG